MGLSGRARPTPVSRPSPAPSPARPGAVPGSSPFDRTAPLRAAITRKICVEAAMALTVRERSTGHLCLCRQPRRRKPRTIGVGRASLLERLSQSRLRQQLVDEKTGAVVAPQDRGKLAAL